MCQNRIRAALTTSHEKFGNQSKANGYSKKYSTFRALYLKLVSSVAEDANITRQVHFTFEVGAERVKTLQETITFADKRKSLLVIKIQEVLWRKVNNLRPLFSRNKER